MMNREKVLREIELEIEQVLVLSTFRESSYEISQIETPSMMPKSSTTGKGRVHHLPVKDRVYLLIDEVMDDMIPESRGRDIPFLGVLQDYFSVRTVNILLQS
jgi:hypothetical protein